MLTAQRLRQLLGVDQVAGLSDVELMAAYRDCRLATLIREHLVTQGVLPRTEDRGVEEFGQVIYQLHRGLVSPERVRREEAMSAAFQEAQRARRRRGPSRMPKRRTA